LLATFCFIFLNHVSFWNFKYNLNWFHNFFSLFSVLSCCCLSYFIYPKMGLKFYDYCTFTDTWNEQFKSWSIMNIRGWFYFFSGNFVRIANFASIWKMKIKKIYLRREWNWKALTHAAVCISSNSTLIVRTADFICRVLRWACGELVEILQPVFNKLLICFDLINGTFLVSRIIQT